MAKNRSGGRQKESNTFDQADNSSLQIICLDFLFENVNDDNWLKLIAYNTNDHLVEIVVHHQKQKILFLCQQKCTGHYKLICIHM